MISDDAFDAEVGELDAAFANTKDPDGSVLDLHFVGNVSQPIFVSAEVPHDLVDGADVSDLVDVRGHAAWAEVLDSSVQFQSSR